MIIEKNRVVLAHYSLTEGTAEGNPIESTKGGEPLAFLFGTDSMIPAFEAKLAGLKTGDAFSFGIPAADAYGEFDPTAVARIPKSVFAIESGQVPVGLLQVGRMLPMQDQDGHQMNGIIAAVEADSVMVDFNHPMAGTDLFFDGHVQEVRLASAVEIEHGHVHGPGGHHH